MACSKWEETGLLYTSNELDELEVESFENHLKLCKECIREYESYQREKSAYFTADILCESPSPETDAEILRVCSSGKPKQFTGSGFFPLFLKKTAFSVTFFVLGFIVVGYFTMVIENPGRSNKKVLVENKIDSLSHPSSVIADNFNQKDSLRFDSLNDTNNYFSKSRGNLEVNGVYPIDLNDK